MLGVDVTKAKQPDVERLFCQRCFLLVNGCRCVDGVTFREVVLFACGLAVGCGVTWLWWGVVL